MFERHRDLPGPAGFGSALAVFRPRTLAHMYRRVQPRVPGVGAGLVGQAQINESGQLLDDRKLRRYLRQLCVGQSHLERRAVRRVFQFVQVHIPRVRPGQHGQPQAGSERARSVRAPASRLEQGADAGLGLLAGAGQDAPPRGRCARIPGCRLKAPGQVDTVDPGGPICGYGRRGLSVRWTSDRALGDGRPPGSLHRSESRTRCRWGGSGSGRPMRRED